MKYLQPGTPSYQRANLALFAGGFATFAVLYSIQPLMPNLTADFGVSPALASLSLSVATGVMAIVMVVAGSLSESWGRKPVMTVSLFATSLLGLLTPLSPNFGILLWLRALQGLALAWLPAVAMAYLSEEVEPAGLGLAMGLYISGNSLGGLGGRVIASMLTDLTSWRVGLGAVGISALLASIWFAVSLPPSNNFTPRPLQLGTLSASLFRHLRDPGLLALYGVGFLIMGSFVTLFNYVGYLLIAPPYRLSQALVGWIFVVYLVGTFSSTWMGRLADRHGRRQVLWGSLAIMLAGTWLTLALPLVLKILGIAVFIFGFFGAHSIASSWVGRRALQDRAQASALYLLFYYVGSSIGGTAGGLLWSSHGWPGVVAMITLLLLGAIALAARLRAIKPVAAPAVAR